MLLTSKENAVCFHIQLLMPNSILGGLADTFLILSGYLFILLNLFNFVLWENSVYCPRSVLASADSAKLFPDYNFHVTFKMGITVDSNVVFAQPEWGECFAALPWERGCVWNAAMPWAVHAR